MYHLPGSTGWTPLFCACPILEWNPEVQTGDADFGVHSKRFGFNITGTSNLIVVVEASMDAGDPIWTPVGTNTLDGGVSLFRDPDRVSFPSRFYRLRSP